MELIEAFLSSAFPRQTLLKPSSETFVDGVSSRALVLPSVLRRESDITYHCWMDSLRFVQEWRFLF